MQFLQTIAEHSRDLNLECLLIGGHAVTALGYPRATFDVDLLIDTNDAHAWKNLFIGLGFTLFHENENFIQLEPKPDWPLPPVDLMLVQKEVLSRLLEESHDTIPLKTPSPLALIALKLHAIYQPQRDRVTQDWNDIFALMEVHHFSLEDSSFNSIVKKYGGEKAVEYIRKHKPA